LQALVGEQLGEGLVGRAEKRAVRAEPGRGDGRRRHHAEGHQSVVVGGGDLVRGQPEQLRPEAADHHEVRVQAVHEPGDAPPDRAGHGLDRGQRARIVGPR
jgi:hypothetical protein